MDSFLIVANSSQLKKHSFATSGLKLIANAVCSQSNGYSRTGESIRVGGHRIRKVVARSIWVNKTEERGFLYVKPHSFYVAIVFIPCVEYYGKETVDTSSKDHREVL